jgi:hypothetical protein
MEQVMGACPEAVGDPDVLRQGRGRLGLGRLGGGCQALAGPLLAELVVLAADLEGQVLGLRHREHLGSLRSWVRPEALMFGASRRQGDRATDRGRVDVLTGWLSGR